MTELNTEPLATDISIASNSCSSKEPSPFISPNSSATFSNNSTLPRSGHTSPAGTNSGYDTNDSPSPPHGYNRITPAQYHESTHLGNETGAFRTLHVSNGQNGANLQNGSDVQNRSNVQNESNVSNDPNGSSFQNGFNLQNGPSLQNGSNGSNVQNGPNLPTGPGSSFQNDSDEATKPNPPGPTGNPIVHGATTNEAYTQLAAAATAAYTSHLGAGSPHYCAPPAADPTAAVAAYASQFGAAAANSYYNSTNPTDAANQYMMKQGQDHMYMNEVYRQQQAMYNNGRHGSQQHGGLPYMPAPHPVVGLPPKYPAQAAPGMPPGMPGIPGAPFGWLGISKVTRPKKIRPAVPGTESLSPLVAAHRPASGQLGGTASLSGDGEEVPELTEEEGRKLGRYFETNIKNVNLKRPRTTFSPETIRVLEQTFAAGCYMSRQQRQDLALRLNLTERQVKIWFQNKRMKEKKHGRVLQQTNRGESFAVTSSISPSAMHRTTAGELLDPMARLDGEAGNSGSALQAMQNMVTTLPPSYSAAQAQYQPQQPTFQQQPQHSCQELQNMEEQMRPFLNQDPQQQQHQRYHAATFNAAFANAANAPRQQEQEQEKKENQNMFSI